MHNMKGMLFNIQRFSTGDGPGIRTTVFFKGCPLRCLWCHNPESQSHTAQLLYYKQKCVRCALCASVCPTHAIRVQQQGNEFDRNVCTLCRSCADACSKDAIEIMGHEFTVDDIMQSVMKDRIFYAESGGVTLSGGEPLAQPEFAIALMCRLNAEGIHTALDTCGYCERDIFVKAISYADLLLFDLKQMDPEKHRHYTGVDNVRILSNFSMAAESGKKIVARVPIIPGINDDSENLLALTKFLKPYSDVMVEPLAYHVYGVSKYEAVGRPYQLTAIQPPTIERMNEIKKVLKLGGLNVINA